MAVLTLSATATGAQPLGSGRSPERPPTVIRTGPRSIPDTPVRQQLRWLLTAAKHLPIADDAFSEHFAAVFRAQISVTQLNATLGGFSGKSGLTLFCESTAALGGPVRPAQPSRCPCPTSTRLFAVDDARRYLDIRHLFVGEAASIEATVGVPACPGWDVHDLIAHQVHQLSSACAGTFPVQDALDAIAGADPARRREARARQDRWVAGGIVSRRGVPIVQLAAEWDALVSGAPTVALAGLFPDLAVHFFDLLGSVGNAEYRDEAFVVPALRFWARYCEIRLQQAGRRPARLELAGASGNEGPIGPVDASLVVAGTPFELLRSITGRRSVRQADALRWEGADEVARECLCVYGWRVHDLDE